MAYVVVSTNKLIRQNIACDKITLTLNETHFSGKNTRKSVA